VTRRSTCRAVASAWSREIGEHLLHLSARAQKRTYQNASREVKMGPRTTPYRRLALLLFLISGFSFSTLCQQPRQLPVTPEAPRIDFLNSRAFPHLFAPYNMPFVPAPRLDNSGRLDGLIVDGNPSRPASHCIVNECWRGRLRNIGCCGFS
jgi:hypothetical protein